MKGRRRRRQWRRRHQRGNPHWPPLLLSHPDDHGHSRSDRQPCALRMQTAFSCRDANIPSPNARQQLPKPKPTDECLHTHTHTHTAAARPVQCANEMSQCEWRSCSSLEWSWRLQCSGCRSSVHTAMRESSAEPPIRSDPMVAVCVCALTCIDVLVEAVAEDHDALQTQTPIGPQNVVVQGLKKRGRQETRRNGGGRAHIRR